jgi:tetratricopeptide (TPR) repeat protein
MDASHSARPALRGPVDPLLGAAAVCHLLDLERLATATGATAAEVAQKLLPLVDTEREPDGVSRWTLRPAIRRQLLAGASPELAAKWIAMGPGAVDTPTEQVLRLWLTGKLDVGAALAASGNAVRRVAGWLRDCRWIALSADGVLEAIAADELRMQLERAASPTFVGRSDELKQLGQLLTGPRLAVIEAPGGMGKSALLARFFLDWGAFTPQGPIVLMADFDDASVSVLDLEAFFAELARQAALQQPSLPGFERSFREHGAQFRRINQDELGDSFRGQEDSRVYGLWRYFAEALSGTDRPWILVLDTVERAQHVSPRLVEMLLAELRQTIYEHSRASLLVSGRGPLNQRSLDNVERMRLGTLGLEDARNMLIQLSVAPALADRLLEIVPRSPLTLRLAARALLGVGGQVLDDRQLHTVVQLARVDGYLHERVLAHLPSVRLGQVARLAIPLLHITPERLHRIVGPLLDPPIDEAEAEVLFDQLTAISDLVSTPSNQRRLTLRPEIWVELLELVSQDLRMVPEIHRRALAALAGSDDEDAIFERTYHLLSLGRPPDAELTPELLARLSEIAPALPRAAKAWLAHFELQRSVADTTAQAGALASAGRLQEAVDLVVSSGARDPNALLIAGRAELQLGRKDEAKSLIDQALATATNHAERAAALQLGGTILEMTGQTQQARNWYLRALAELTVVKDAGVELSANVALGIARVDPDNARYALERTLESRDDWRQLADANRGLVRKAAVTLGTRAALEMAAEVDAFSLSSEADFTRLGACLARHPKVAASLSTAVDAASLSRALAELQRKGELSSAMRYILANAGDDPEIIQASIEILSQADVLGAKTSPLFPQERAAQLASLAAELAGTITSDSWRDIMRAISPTLESKWLHETDLRLAIHDSLTEIDRKGMGALLSEKLVENGLDKAAHLSADLFDVPKEDWT